MYERLGYRTVKHLAEWGVLRLAAPPVGGGRRRRCALKRRAMEFLARWRRWAAQLQREVYAVYLAYRDPRVPWYARVFAACVVGYAFNPLDLIPDPIPILGALDDLVLIPLGVKMALAMIPPSIMAESREKAQEAFRQGRPVSWTAAVVVVAIWLLLAALAVAVVVRAFRG